MKEPRILGDIMKEFLLESNDEYAVAFRRLYKEHGSDFLEPKQEEKEVHYDQ